MTILFKLQDFLMLDALSKKWMCSASIALLVFDIQLCLSKDLFFSWGFYLMNPVALDQWKCTIISQWVKINLKGAFLLLHTFQSPNFYNEFILRHRHICVMCTQKNPVHIFYFTQLSADCPYVILNFILSFFLIRLRVAVSK